MLLGRATERARIERLLSEARRSRGGALVIRGEPGIGKTSLLRYAIDLAEAMTVVRAVGVESEAELEFSGLLEVCRPLLTGLDGLPDHQAETLRGALGMSSTRPGDRFAVGAATLGLLALVAESRPLLVVVDDGQWIDVASVDALSFAARRLTADAVAFLFAVREDSTAFTGGFDELALEGLDAESASRLLSGISGTTVPATVAAQVVEATRGNPLGLVELPLVLSAEQLAGEARIEEPLPVGAGVQSSYSSSIGCLPEQTQRALEVLALSTSGQVDVIAQALASFGGVEALEPAEDAGLVVVQDERFVFRHPLVRSAIVHAAFPSTRRGAHRLLADAFTGRQEEERRAWHLAAAAVGPDDEAATALAAAAGKARSRGGHEAASEAFERAARLTTAEASRLEWIADAAEASLSAGDSSRVKTLVANALPSALDAGLRARLLRLEGRIELQTGSASRARELFLESSSFLGERDAADSVTTLGLAVFASHFEGRIAEALEIARRARDLAPDDRAASGVQAGYLLGRCLLLAGKPEEGTPILEGVLAGLLGSDDRPRVALSRAAIVLAVLERSREAVERAREASRMAREDGPMALTYSLSLTTDLDVRHGRWTRALATAAEGLSLARELEQSNIAAHFLASLARVDAARGNEDTCRASALGALELLGPAGMALPTEHVACSLGLLELGLDHLEESASILANSSRNVAAMGFFDRDILPDPDLVEALVRLGRGEDAAQRLDVWLERGGGEATKLGSTLAARCRGLVAGESEFERHFRDALDSHEEVDDPFAEARTRLCLGERLRRAGRRVDARRELRAALDTFERLEAEAWIKRTRRELRATGEKLGRRAAVSGDELTAQELQVALQVAEGKTNREAGAALFLSPKTVEFHLARVYRKLEISSRAELIRHFAESGEPVPVV